MVVTVTADERWDIHFREHKQETEARDLALASIQALQHAHDSAHDKAHEAHEEKHDAEERAVQVALAAVDRERTIHAEAHEREHEGHLTVHDLNRLAIDKAAAANDLRFKAANDFKETFSNAITQLASKESLALFQKERRESMDSLRSEFERRLTVLERNDVRAEGKGIGQGATIAHLVTAVTVVLLVMGVLLGFYGGA